VGRFQVVPKLETFVSKVGRAVIIGDAAHASKPNGGQGGSVSLEDVATLAIAIKKSNTKSDFGEGREILGRWDNIRMKRIEQVANALMSIGMHMVPDEPFMKEGWTKENDPLFWLYGYETDDIFELL
jgi:2-polyprenyl-6-methoxyphenol hydroxylase-like FAD-dependent oxidoreductase